MPPKQIALLYKKSSLAKHKLVEQEVSAEEIAEPTVAKEPDALPTTTSEEEPLIVEPPPEKVVVASPEESSALGKAEELKQLVENEDYSNNDVILNTEQQEALIDSLETKKYKLKQRYRKTDPSETELKERLQKEYDEIKRLLSSVKQCDAWDKVYKNQKSSKELRDKFKSKYKQLPKEDFVKIIDLTAPKEERKPEESTEKIWRQSKQHVFKGKTYRPPPADKFKRFKQKMRPRKMPSQFQERIEQSLNGNLRNITHKQTKPSEALGYVKYDPLNFKGMQHY